MAKKHPEMDGKAREDCIHHACGTRGCNHPDKGCWSFCDTMHISPFDKDSCQNGMYVSKNAKKAVKKDNTMKASGLFVKAAKPVKTTEPFYFRLVEASSYPGSVAVEAVDKFGERISLICRISKEMGIEAYADVDKELGFALDSENAVIVQTEATV